MRFSVTGQVARESSRPKLEPCCPKKKSNHMIDFYVAKVFMALLETEKKFLKLTKCPWVRNEYIPNEQRLIFFGRNGERFPLLLETNNAFRIFTQTYFNSKHTIDFCVVSPHGIVRNHEKVSQAYETSMSKTRLHTKRLTLHLVVRNEQRFKNLHGVVGNKERFGDKKFSTLLPIYSLKFRSF